MPDEPIPRPRAVLAVTAEWQRINREDQWTADVIRNGAPYLARDLDRLTEAVSHGIPMHTPTDVEAGGAGEVCSSCGGHFANRHDRLHHLCSEASTVETGRRLASERDDLIAAGADPSELIVPLSPLSRLDRLDGLTD